MRKAKIVRTPPPGAEPAPLPPQGFKAALAALADRKYRELKGQWVTGTERAKRKEAMDRATRDMAKRVARETGKAKPLAASTIRRYAAKDQQPKGIDDDRMRRQILIDQAGGVAAFARRTRLNPHRVQRWRDTGGAMAGAAEGPLTLIPNVDGYLIRKGERYPKKGIAYEVTLDAADSDRLRVAQALDDEETIKEIVGDAIAMQWFPQDAQFEVSVINSLEVRS